MCLISTSTIFPLRKHFICSLLSISMWKTHFYKAKGSVSCHLPLVQWLGFRYLTATAGPQSLTKTETLFYAAIGRVHQRPIYFMCLKGIQGQPFFLSALFLYHICLSKLSVAIISIVIDCISYFIFGVNSINRYIRQSYIAESASI